MKVTTFVGVLSISLSAWAQGGEVIGFQSSPVVQPQYQTPWCYAMAAKTLLKQVICESNRNCGTGSEPDIAVAGVISAHLTPAKALDGAAPVGEAVKWFRGGDQEAALRQLSMNRVVPTGACTHEKELFKFHQDRKFAFGLSLSVQLEIIFTSFQKYYEESLKNQTPGDRAEVARYWLEKYGKALAIDNLNLEFLIPALATAKDFDHFVKDVLLPEGCQSTGLQFPSFHVVSHSETEAKKIETLIDQGLSKGRLVSLSICAAKIGALLEECGSHAVVVSQSRKDCSSGKCLKEYRFLDSSFFSKSAVNPDGSSWMPAEKVVFATQAYGQFVEKIRNKIKEDFKAGETAVGSLKNTLINYEIIISEIKTKAQESVEQFIQAMRENRRKYYNYVSTLSNQQITEMLKQNPDLQIYADEEKFQKNITDLTEPIIKKSEADRFFHEENLKKLRAQMIQIYDSFKNNAATGSSNILWLE